MLYAAVPIALIFGLLRLATVRARRDKKADSTNLPESD